MEHLKQDDFERYIDSEEETTEYFAWMNTVEAHLDVCEECSKKLEKYINAGIMLDTLLSKDALDNLAEEEKLKRLLIVQKLVIMGQKQRAAQLEAAILAGNIFVRTVRANIFSGLNPVNMEKSLNAGRIPMPNSAAAPSQFMSMSASIPAEPGMFKPRMEIRTEKKDDRLEIYITGNVKRNVAVVINDRSDPKAEPITVDAVYKARADRCEAAVSQELLPKEYDIICFDPGALRTPGKKAEKKNKKSEGLGSLRRFFNRER